MIILIEMELKAPTPLGGGEVQQEVKKEDEVIKVKRKPLFNLPKFNIPCLKNLTSEKKRKFTEISIIAIPATLLLILAIMILNFVASEPYRMGREFLKSIEERNIEKAFSMTTEAYQAVTPIKEFRKITDKLISVDISHPKLSSKNIEEIKGMGKYAYIKYKISGYNVDLTLFNDSIDWGIHSIKIYTTEQK